MAWLKGWLCTNSVQRTIVVSRGTWCPVPSQSVFLILKGSSDKDSRVSSCCLLAVFLWGSVCYNKLENKLPLQFQDYRWWGSQTGERSQVNQSLKFLLPFRSPLPPGWTILWFHPASHPEQPRVLTRTFRLAVRSVDAYLRPASRNHMSYYYEPNFPLCKRTEFPKAACWKGFAQSPAPDVVTGRLWLSRLSSGARWTWEQLSRFKPLGTLSYSGRVKWSSKIKLSLSSQDRLAEGGSWNKPSSTSRSGLLR